MGRAELPSVIAEQKCLIEDLAQSNQEYILKFERLKLGIEEPPGRPVNDASKSGVVERESSNITKSLSGTLTRKFERMKSTIARTSLQDKESTRGLGSEEFNTAPWSSPKAQRSITGSLATPPNADINNMFINTSVQDRTTRPPVQERGIPTTEAPMAFGQEALFKQLEHHSMLIKNLLKEVDEAQYKITLQSRWRMRGGIEGLYEGEKRDLEKTWGLTALQSAVQRLDSLKEGIGELPRVNSFAAPVASAKPSPSMADNIGTSRLFEDALSVDNMNRRPSVSHPMPEMRSWNPLPARTPTVKLAGRARRTSNSPSKSKRLADIAKAKAEEQRKSSTIGKRKDTGDRIGGYTEPHQEEDDTGEGGVDMTTPFSRPYLSPSAGERSENIWRQGTDSASSSSVKRRRGFTLHSPIVRTPINHIHVRYNQLMVSYRQATPLEVTWMSMARTPSTTSTKETLRD